MIRTNRWTNDTCGCALVYEWDDALPQDERVHTYLRADHQCAAHAGLPLVEHVEDVVDENSRKNRLGARLLQAFPGAVGMTATDGSLVLRPDAFTFTIEGKGRANRVLYLSLPLLSNAQRTAVQTWANTNIGAGKVVVSA